MTQENTANGGHATMPAFDTVDNAQATPDKEMPYAELGLKANEYDLIKDMLGRRPTDAELAMYSVMWSEHCSYKSSKKHLKEQFGSKTTDAMKKHMLVGLGENAGVIDIGDGWAVTFKVESHNHPSFVEPYQGAATGVGGIVRDIISMGARPVAVMDQLRMGDPHDPDTVRVTTGAVAGIGGYGNSLGVPNIGGETQFDASYQGNPLVNALSVGVMRHDDLHLAKAAGQGNKVVLFGARTGGDGIGGASILASETFEEGMPAKRPSVQVGDPFMEKVLIECCLELFANDLVEGIQDLGAAGISCATSELAAGGDSGMYIHLENVLLRDPTLNAGEILMSESQERMMAVVAPDKLDRFMEIINKWDVEASVIGEVTDEERLIIDHFGQRIVDVPPKTVAVDSPVYDRPYERPDWQDDLQANTVAKADLPVPQSTEELYQQMVALVTDPNQAASTWVTQQYDSLVQGGTALAQPDDAGVIRVDEKTHRGVAVATDANGWYTKLDPYTGAQQALAEAYRNVCTVGAEPMGVTDCLNFGNPETTDGMWQLVQSMTGMADGCKELEIPVTGGNVSLYNSSGEGKDVVSINPTPLAGVLGVMPDVRDARPSGWQEDGLAIMMLGETRAELDGSAWARLHGHLGGMPPAVDLDAEARLGRVLVAIASAKDEDGHHYVRAAHDLSIGGLMQSLADAVMRFGVGANIDLDQVIAGGNDNAFGADNVVDDFVKLVSESQARALVAVPEGAQKLVQAAATAEGVPVSRIGTTGGDLLTIVGSGIAGGKTIADQLTFDVAALTDQSQSVLPALFN